MNPRKKQVEDLNNSLNELAKQGAYIAFIDGIPKVVWDADKYPHLANPEETRRSEERKSNEEKKNEEKRLHDLMKDIILTCLCLQAANWEERFRIALGNRALELLQDDMQKNLVTCMNYVVTLPHNLAIDVPDELKKAVKVIVEFNLLKQETMFMLTERINSYQELINRVDVVIIKKLEKTATIYNNALDTLVKGKINGKFEGIDYELDKSNYIKFTQEKIHNAVVNDKKSDDELSKVIKQGFGEFLRNEFDKQIKPKLQERNPNLSSSEIEAKTKAFTEAQGEMNGFNNQVLGRQKEAQESDDVQATRADIAEAVEVKGELEAKRDSSKAKREQVKQSQISNVNDEDAAIQNLKAKDDMAAMKQQLESDKDDFDNDITIAKRKIATLEQSRQTPHNTTDMFKKMQQTNGQNTKLNNVKKPPESDTSPPTSTTPSTPPVSPPPKKDDNPDKDNPDKDNSENNTPRPKR